MLLRTSSMILNKQIQFRINAYSSLLLKENPDAHTFLYGIQRVHSRLLLIAMKKNGRNLTMMHYTVQQQKYLWIFLKILLIIEQYKGKQREKMCTTKTKIRHIGNEKQTRTHKRKCGLMLFVFFARFSQLNSIFIR
jgi:hypothetical protein